MSGFKDFDESKMVEYSLEDLKAFVSEIEMMKSVINQKLADEITEELRKDSFDMYSRKGEKKIKKISAKYMGSLIGADSYIDLLNEEIKKRERHEEEMRYSGRSIRKQNNMSEEEFLQHEQDKTWSYRSKIE